MPKVSRKESAKPLQAVVDGVRGEEEAGPRNAQRGGGGGGGADGARAGSQSGGGRRRYAPDGAPDSGIKGGSEQKVEFRRVGVPQHRVAPLKDAWLQIYEPVTKVMGLDMRMNLKTRKVEIKTSSAQNQGAGARTASGMVIDSSGALQRAADFVQAFILGFAVQDAVALLRMDDLYVERFEIKDVKTLKGEHLARCIGRIAGKNGKTKFTIENATKTRIVLADTHIHILGSFANIKVARDAICSLILGSPAGKVYTKLRSVAARVAEG